MGKKRSKKKNQPPAIQQLKKWDSERERNLISRWDTLEEWNLIFEMSHSMYVEDKITEPLLSRCLLQVPAGEPPTAANLDILVPGLGNSNLAERLRAVGFTKILESDVSKFLRPDSLLGEVDDVEKLWNVWDAAFADETIDAVVDKVGLDLLAVPNNGFAKSGFFYVNKLKRILKPGGKYICITLAESELLDLLFRDFRCGWKTTLYAISTQIPTISTQIPRIQIPTISTKIPRTQIPTTSTKIPRRMHTFMVVLEKDKCGSVSEISVCLNDYSPKIHVRYHGEDEVKYFNNALRIEGQTRSKYSDFRTVKELDLQSLEEFEPGRTIKLILGDPCARYFYKAVLVDAGKHPARPFLHQFALCLVPKARVNEWCFSSEEGQLHFASNFGAARILMILLDSGNDIPEKGRIKDYLGLLALPLAPRNYQEFTIFILPAQKVNELDIEADPRRTRVAELMSCR